MIHSASFWVIVMACTPIVPIVLGISAIVIDRRRLARQREADRLAFEADRLVFRRHDSFGPLWVPIERIERIRLAVIADQLSAEYVASTEDAEPAEIIARTAYLEPAAIGESAEGVEIAMNVASTAGHERVLHWLMKWHDGGLPALTRPVLA